MSTLLTPAPAIKADRATDSSHWYLHENGAWSPLYTPEKNYTLREARKDHAAGRVVVPSVTTIFRTLNKRQLVEWQRENVAKTCLVTPRHRFESDSEYIDHVLAVADGASKGAADLGTRIHTAIENALAGKDWDADLTQYVDVTMKALEERGLLGGISEACTGSMVNGYGGRVDLHIPSKRVTVDFKSRKSKGKKVPTYGTDEMQLASYSEPLHGNQFFVDGTAFVLAISTTVPGLLTVHEFAGKDLIQAYEAFLGLAQVWRFENSFDPRRVA